VLGKKTGFFLPRLNHRVLEEAEECLVWLRCLIGAKETTARFIRTGKTGAYLALAFLPTPNKLTLHAPTIEAPK
jgi:hypothetical protein